jgi:coproporphyrinogen III oxidase-like Fe-S oxidoreductase
MHYNGPIIRPPHEAYSLMLETTVGCTHNSCRFCTFYKDAPFRMAPLSQVEADLREVARQAPDLEHLWFSGGDPLTLSMDRLETLIGLTHQYLPKASISMYGRVDSTFRKSVDDLRHLKDLGVDDIVIGIESAYDPALKAMNKGYTADELLRECRKYEEAGMTYRVIYLAGIAGHDHWKENAEATAEALNQLHPSFMYLTSLSIQQDSPLYADIQEGKFTPETEFDMVKEFYTLIKNMENPIRIDARAGYNPVHFYVDLPDSRKILLDDMKKFIDSCDEQTEQELEAHRASYTTV